MSFQSKHNFNIALVGDCRVGKTTFLRRHRTGEFQREHIPTTESVVSTLKFNTTEGMVTINVLEDKQLSPPIEHSQALIIMFSVDDKSSFLSAKKYYDELKNKYPTSLIVVCGTKRDCVNRQVTTTDAKKFASCNKLQYYDTSAKTCYNIENPFLYIIKRLLMNDTVKFKSYDISAEHDE